VDHLLAFVLYSVSYFEMLGLQDKTDAACTNVSRAVGALGQLSVLVTHSKLKLSVFTVTCFGWLGHLPVIQIHSLIPLACAECNDSLPFSGASSIPLL
jgi:predicted membrane channel-forming protein YqfA (hemolysin III family)